VRAIVVRALIRKKWAALLRGALVFILILPSRPS
jgi:hypothetical protein